MLPTGPIFMQTIVAKCNSLGYNDIYWCALAPMA